MEYDLTVTSKLCGLHITVKNRFTDVQSVAIDAGQVPATLIISLFMSAAVCSDKHNEPLRTMVRSFSPKSCT